MITEPEGNNYFSIIYLVKHVEMDFFYEYIQFTSDIFWVNWD